MNAMTMLESVSDSGIRELSLDEIEMIGGGHNTRGMPYNPFRGGAGGGSIFSIAVVVFDYTARYIHHRWGRQIGDFFTRMPSHRPTSGQMGRSRSAPDR